MVVDQARLFLRAGHGGAGSASLHSEPYKPRGGPDGGDGGRGGDVILRVDPSVFDLADLAAHPHQAARNGGAGASNRRTGAGGADRTLVVPDGTVVRDERGLVADLVGAGASVVVARGGRGGRGNAALASARNRVPTVAEPGEHGEERTVDLELRTVADLGLVGLPNAGKSTILSRLTAATPKIADYPFTTLSPNVGVAGTDHRFVVADVPGLIEGAHEGRGLGLDFLRHVSRCRVLAYVVDLSAPDPSDDLEVVRSEVAAYDPELATRRSLVVGTKADLPASAPPPPDVDVVVSGTVGSGLDELEARLDRMVAEAKAAERPPEAYVVVRPAREAFSVAREGPSRFRVSGSRVERWVAEVDMDDDRQVADLQRRLIRAGVERRLADEGARAGDEVVIGGVAFEFVPEPPPTRGSGRRMADTEGP
jgi:GTP-binding protein